MNSITKHVFLALCIAFSCTHATAHNQPKHPIRHSAKQPANHVVFTSESFLIADADGNILKEHRSNIVRPIASISKLLLALIASTQDLDESLDIPTKRTVRSSIPLNQRQLTRRELLTMALVKSDNFAALILCQNIYNCIDTMNAKAKSIGMLQTSFDEPTGLSQNNVSTAADLLKLMIVASSNRTLTYLSSMSHAEIQGGKNTIKIRNTNPLTSTQDIILTKTGFTNPAGGCISMIIGRDKGQRVIILLGSRNTHTRINESLKLYRDSVM